MLKISLGSERDEVTGTWKDYVPRSRSAFFTKKYLGETIKKNEIGGACGTCGGEEGYIQNFGAGVWGKDRGLDVKVKLKWILRKSAERLSGLDLSGPG